MAAPTPTTQILNDDAERTVIKVVIPGGGDANVSAATIVDVSELVGAPTRVAIEKVDFSIYNCAATLIWDATSDVNCMILSGTGIFEYRSGTPLVNNAGSGVTGDIQLSTINYSGTGVSGGTIILYLVKP
jgi:hypothetical protein